MSDPESEVAGPRRRGRKSCRVAEERTPITSRRVLPVISSTRRTQHLDSPIVELPLPSIYVSPTIHTATYLTFSSESLVLSDLLLPNLAL